jgi:hypothetical protein
MIEMLPIIGLLSIGLLVAIHRLRQLPRTTRGKWTRIFTWKYVYANDAAGFVRFKFVWYRIYNDWKDGTTTTIYRESMD